MTTQIPMAAHRLVMLCNSVSKMAKEYHQLRDDRFIEKFKHAYRDKETRSYWIRFKTMFGFPPPIFTHEQFKAMALKKDLWFLNNSFERYPCKSYNSDIKLANTLEQAAEYALANVSNGTHTTIMVDASQLATLVASQSQLKKLVKDKEYFNLVQNARDMVMSSVAKEYF